MDFDFKEKFPENVRQASFIFQLKSGSAHEYKFYAENDLDIINKGQFLREIMIDQIVGMVYDWSDSEAIYFHRNNLFL